MAKFHYTIQLASWLQTSELVRRPAREPARELDSVMEFGLDAAAGFQRWSVPKVSTSDGIALTNSPIITSSVIAVEQKDLT